MQIKRILPIFEWLPAYKKSAFKGDLWAGLTVGVMLIPQGMAYAMIAGLPPIYGLYAAFLPQIIYSFFGTSRQLSVAPAAMISLLIGAGISELAVQGSEAYIKLAILLALIVGILQLLFGLFRMGFLVNFSITASYKWLYILRSYYHWLEPVTTLAGGRYAFQ